MGLICLYLHNISSEEQGQLRKSEQQLREMRSSSSSPLNSEKEHEETEEIDYFKDTIKSMAHRQMCTSVKCDLIEESTTPTNRPARGVNET